MLYEEIYIRKFFKEGLKSSDWIVKISFVRNMGMSDLFFFCFFIIGVF